MVANIGAVELAVERAVIFHNGVFGFGRHFSVVTPGGRFSAHTSTGVDQPPNRRTRTAGERSARDRVSAPGSGSASQNPVARDKWQPVNVIRLPRSAQSRIMAM